jgi:hypothetical protein
MKGKSVFSKAEIKELEELIILRNNTPTNGQKAIRDKMRRIGFYGRDDWGISDLQISDLHSLMEAGLIKVTNEDKSSHQKEMITIENDRLGTKVVQSVTSTKINKDEYYILDLCDMVLQQKSLRQHRFDFLLGDANIKGVVVKLPVDAFYPKLNLVIEYCERQHTETVSFFDKPDRLTISGVNRGEQRRIYDDRRREVLREHSISLIEISYFDFNYDSNKRIIRNKEYDKAVISERLKDFL